MDTSKFIRVTKDNETKDRGFIAVDAICSVFENNGGKNVSIMTMDGFWYDVVDGIEKLWNAVSGKNPCVADKRVQPETKAGYFKRKRMLPAPNSDKAPVDGEKARKDRVEVVGRAVKAGGLKIEVKRPQVVSPTGVGEGRSDA